MSFPNKDLTIHLNEHTEPRAECDLCEALIWGDTLWTKEDQEKYAEAMNEEMATLKE